MTNISPENTKKQLKQGKIHDRLQIYGTGHRQGLLKIPLFDTDRTTDFVAVCGSATSGFTSF